MPRKFSVLFTFLLLFQLITPAFAAPAETAAEGSKIDIYDKEDFKIDDEETEETNVIVPWSMDEEEVEAGDTAVIDIPEPYEIKEVDEDKSTDDEEIIDSYTTEGQEVTITFNEKAEEVYAAKGELVVQVVNLEVREQLEKEAEEKKQAEQEEKEKKQKEQEEKEAAEENENNENNEENASKENSNDEKSAEKENDSTEKESNDEADKKEGSDNSSDAESENASNEEEDDNNNETEESDDNNSDEKKSTAKVQATSDDNDKHGFKLELDEILDLDDEAFDKQHPMDPHKEFKVKLDWELEDGHNYVEGDTEIFDLPKGIKINKNISIELKDDQGQIVANAVVTPDKKVELTFTDFVEGHSSVSGWMEIISELDIEEVEEEDGEIIIDPIGEEGELRIPIEKENKDKTIEKKGTPDGYNADEINWEVVVNKNKTSLKDASVTDALPKGTEYKDGSLKVTKLKADLDGNILGDGEEVDIIPEVNEAGELVVPLGDTNDAYRVEYVTTVTDDEETEFKNDATLTDEELNDVSADSTVTINRGEPLKKGAVKDYDPETGIIEWYLEFNYNQKELNDVTLADNWKPEGKVELVDDSVTFQEMEIDENGNAKSNGEPVKPGEIGATGSKIDDGFEVSGITTDKPYYVVYQTKVIDRELDGFRMENLASFGDHEKGTGYNIGQYVGAKSVGEIDYAAKTIEWAIKINSDHQQMNDVTIEDTIGKGLTLVEDSIEMTIGGQPKKDFKLENEDPFTLTNIGDTKEEIIVTYKTEFDADKVPDHIAKNKADISWVPEDGSDRINKEVEAETELNEHTQNNDWKNGSYNPETKEITWEIIANYRENNITDLNIVDKPQGNQQILDGSAVVTELDIAKNGDISEGDIVDSAATIDEDANTLDVALGETDKAYKIVYKTSLEGLDDMQDEYVNEAEVLDGDESLSEIDAKVGVVKDRKYGNKSGDQDGKQIYWSIDVNLVQQKVADLKLVDKISGNQEYLEDSIKVYDANIDGEGNASKGEKVSSDAYKLDIDQDSGEFTIEWKDEVERAFIVEYSTLFFDKHGADVRNDYTITGDSIEEEDNSASDGYNVTLEQLGSGGGEGAAGYLVIDKVDTTDGGEEKLAGAEFDLIDSETGDVLKSGTTDENGQIDFGRLLFGDYTLKETKVPEGYVTPEEEQTITIEEPYESGDDKEAFEYTVENYKSVFAVEILKKDEDGKLLKNAEFTLFDSDDKEIVKNTTNEDGKIIFADIEEAGDYYVQETKAPSGYVLDETKHEVTIGKEGQEPAKVEAVNKARGAVELTKTDQDTGDKLEGVEFALQKEDDSGSYETVGTFTTNENGQIKTSNTLEAGEYQFVETEGLDGYRANGTPVKFTVNVNSTEKQEFTMENEQYKGSVKLVKKDAATDKELKGATFKLVDSAGEIVKEDLETNSTGEIIVEDLFLGDYQLIETEAPEGYEKDDDPIDVEIKEDNQVVEKTMTNNKITDITVEKEWNNNNGDTESVEVKLLPTDETIELTEDNDWKASFEDLAVYDEDNEAIEYDVEEVAVDGFNSEVTGDTEDGFTVTNTETTDVSGDKTWNDDDSDERPDQITIELFANDEKVEQKQVTADDGWKYAFKDLDKYDEDGNEITYTIDEAEVDGYETDVDGYDIKNTREGTIDVEGEKSWKDVDSTDRPDDITVELSREVDGEADEDFSENKTVTPNDQGNWTYEFSDLAEFDKNGVAYEYVVEEKDISEKYDSVVSDHDITNVRTGETEVSGEKMWKDDKADNRPDSIEVNLLRNDIVVDTKEVTAEDDWKYTFIDLDKYDDEGQLYDYTVKEQDVAGYESEVNGTDITNTRVEKKDIEVNKAWLDDDSEDRPDEVVIYLKQNGDNVDTVELKADNDWKYTFTDLEAFDKDGKAYDYSVEEQAVEGYETSVDGYDITNLRVGETEVSGTKTWLDDDSKDRPEEIEVTLLENGEKTDETITVDADSDWTYEFTGLDKYDNQGEEIHYTVDEEEIDGYEKTIDGNDITNLRIGKTEVTGEKKWDEVDDRYRPDAITVQLFANDEEVDSTEISNDTDWSYAFSGLDKYDDEGKAIEYTIEEPEVPTGYAAEVDEFDITNTQEATEISGEKKWDEVDENYRPEKVEVQLLANGEPEETAELSENNWDYIFDELAKYDKDGEEIDYTVEELDVPKGYDSKVDDKDITNTQESTEVSGEKHWNEVDDRYRPDAVEVQLFANEEEAGTVFMSKDTDWEYVFTNLAKYDQDGEEIDYTVEELNVPKGYDSKVDGYDITNTQEATDISGKKSWDEVDKQYRPEDVTIQLLADGEEEATLEASENTDWEYAFTDLAKYNQAEEEINYTVEEVDVPEGYDTEVEGTDVTNTQKTTEVTGTKTWLDEDKEDRPDSITVQVKNDEDVVAEQDISSKDQEFTFENLPKYNKDGEEINYTVDEDDEQIDGYKKSVEGNDITNLRVDTTAVEGEKEWKNDEEADRPDSITVELLANDEQVDKTKVQADKDGEWNFAFEELDEYDSEGEEIDYVVKEKNVEGYQSKVDGYDITNTKKETSDEETDDPSTGDPSDDPEVDKDKEDKSESDNKSDDEEDSSVTPGKDKEDKSDEDTDSSVTPSKDKKDKSDSLDGSILPKTATNIFSAVLIGAVLLVLGTLLIVSRRKKKA